MKVLIIEDDQNTLENIRDFLTDNEFICDYDRNGLDALHSIRSIEYGIILLDLNIPLISGTELLNKIRQSLKIHTPIIIISAVNNIKTKLHCFNTGADDFLVKPFDKHELIARIYAVKRRLMGYSSSILEYGNLTLNTKRSTAHIGENQISLTKKEYIILELLVMNKGGVISKEAILDALYTHVHEEPQAKIIDVFICKLRKKLVKAGATVKISTMWGRGPVINLMKEDEILQEAGLSDENENVPQKRIAEG